MPDPLDGIELVTGDWSGCYDTSWKGVITDGSFAHPAKMARGLLDRILEHGLERGYWQVGDLLADPFGGIGTTGILAAYKGLRSVSVELEPRFVEMARENIGMHAPKLDALGCPVPVIMLGDSRRFAEIVGEAAGVVTSPPYINTNPEAHGPGIDLKKNYETYRASGGGSSWEKFVASRKKHEAGYGSSAGQIGRLPAGDVAAVVTSPPYAESVKGDHGEKETAAESRAKRRTKGGSLGKSQRHGGYGATAGNIGNLKEGDAQAVRGIITSPPYEDALSARGGRQRAQMGLGNAVAGANDPCTDAIGYSADVKNIGNDAGETYWQAMAQVYDQCRIALKPGGVLAVVIKRYVKNGAIVPLPDQTWTLLQRLGFEPLERIRAMLVKETREAGLFGEVVKKTERKSFFRRLAEGKGAPPIDWEDVLWVRTRRDCSC